MEYINTPTVGGEISDKAAAVAAATGGDAHAGLYGPRDTARYLPKPCSDGGSIVQPVIEQVVSPHVGSGHGVPYGYPDAFRYSPSHYGYNNGPFAGVKGGNVGSVFDQFANDLLQTTPNAPHTAAIYDYRSSPISTAVVAPATGGIVAPCLEGISGPEFENSPATVIYSTPHLDPYGAEVFKDLVQPSLAVGLPYGDVLYEQQPHLPQGGPTIVKQYVPCSSVNGDTGGDVIAVADNSDHHIIDMYEAPYDKFVDQFAPCAGGSPLVQPVVNQLVAVPDEQQFALPYGLHQPYGIGRGPFAYAGRPCAEAYDSNVPLHVEQMANLFVQPDAYGHPDNFDRVRGYPIAGSAAASGGDSIIAPLIENRDLFDEHPGTSYIVHEKPGYPVYHDGSLSDLLPTGSIAPIPQRGAIGESQPFFATPEPSIIMEYINTPTVGGDISNKAAAVAAATGGDAHAGLYGPCETTGYLPTPCTDGGSTVRPIIEQVVTPDVISSSLCPGVSSSVNYECPMGFFFDGSSCVAPEECPCVYKDVRRKSGSVWKEDNGCVNCICISGLAKCTAQTCEIVSCDPGFVLIEVEESCCPVCVEADVSCLDGERKVGEVWSEGCDSCVCTEYGVDCKPMECPASSIPVCGYEYELVQKVAECCPVYECVCDSSLCEAGEANLCPEHYTSIAVDSGGCCPKYQCVCQPDSCPHVYCERHEIKVFTESDGCCSMYRCERSGCLDTAGGWRDVGEVFSCPFNPCTTCTCSANNVLSCTANICPVEETSFCPSGSLPQELLSDDGCCKSLVCDCYCSGMDMNWNTFDDKFVTSEYLGKSLLVEDHASEEFQVFVTRVECRSLTCVDSLEIHDRVATNTAMLTSDGKVFLNGEETAVTADESIKKGFKFMKDLNDKISLEMYSTNLRVSLGKGGRSWSVSLPSTYRGRTTGLCGLCDGQHDNDFWDGHKVLKSQTEFVQHFGIDLIPNIIVIPDTPESEICGQIIEDLFSSCPLDKLLYVKSCITDVSSGGSGCDVFASLASSCRTLGHCIEWRSASLCPYSCPLNMEYRACSSGTLRTCDNFKEYSSLEATFDAEGCFCPDDMVSINGVCSSTLECPVYVDEIGGSHCVGDVWVGVSDPCTTSAVLSDGSLIHKAITCSPTKECSDSETQVVVGEDNCCPIYECIPTETCATVTCPVYDVFECGAGEEAQAIVHDECCVEMTCVCNEALCPTLSQPLCQEGEELVSKSSGCCTMQVCECHADQCPIPTCAGDGYHLVKVDSGRCCPVYECVCEKAYCPDVAYPVCGAGEVLRSVRISDCCLSYECSCDESTCPEAIEYCPDGYKLTKTYLEDACCKEAVECTCDISACPAVQSLQCDANAGYKLITTTTQRFSYSLPSCCPTQYEELCVCDSSLCPVFEEPACGRYESVVYEATSPCCKQPQCVCDISKCVAGSTWCPTNKHATITLVDGCCEQAVCECNECTAPCECAEGWLVTEIFDDCGCLQRICEPPTYCVYNGEHHEPGTSWDEDICVECSCSPSPNFAGEYEVECRDIKCGTCSSGFTYVPVAGACCGDCVPMTCHYDGQQYAVGQSWCPEDNVCTTCTCQMNSVSGEVYTTCVDTMCPPVDPSCPEENILTTADGCCSYCDPTRTIPTKCSPMAQLASYLEYEGCTSETEVNLSTCVGSCESSSVFSVEYGNFTKSCSCCTAVESKDVEVTFCCPDGSTMTKVYKSATECACHASNCVEP